MQPEAALQALCTALQAKPFINEAHVFNDAGLSFDVWPPRTGSPASDTPPKPTAIGLASDLDESLKPSNGQDQPEIGAGVCMANQDSYAESAECEVSPGNGTDVGNAAASDVVGSDMGMSRGYLLALKLWEEAVATVNAVHRSAAHAGA